MKAIEKLYKTHVLQISVNCKIDALLHRVNFVMVKRMLNTEALKL